MEKRGKEKQLFLIDILSDEDRNLNQHMMQMFYFSSSAKKWMKMFLLVSVWVCELATYNLLSVRGQCYPYQPIYTKQTWRKICSKQTAINSMLVVPKNLCKDIWNIGGQVPKPEVLFGNFLLCSHMNNHRK